jgi:hypothetical protein
MTPLGFIPVASENTTPGGIERRENAIAQQKGVEHARGIGVCTHAVTLGVNV